MSTRGTRSATDVAIQEMTSTRVEEHVDAIERAVAPRERECVYRLRYQAYRSVSAIPETDSQRFCDDYDAQPNSGIYLLRHDGVPIGSIRASVWVPASDPLTLPARTRPLVGLGIPSFESYRDAIEERIGLDKTIVESSRFVSAESSYDVLLKMQFELFRMIVANAMVHDADWVVTAVRRKHAPLYRRLFGLRRLSEPRRYYGLDAEMVLVGGDFRAQLPIACQRNSRLSMSELEAGRYAI